MHDHPAAVRHSRNPFALGEPLEIDSALLGYAKLGHLVRASDLRREVVPTELATPSRAESEPFPAPSLLVNDADAVRRVLRWEDVLCPLPGHGGFAELVDHAGELAVECDCLGRTAEWERSGWRPGFTYGLADAYFSVRSGIVLGRGDKRSKGQRFVWRLLLAYEVGLIEPVAVVLPELPSEADPVHDQARTFFALLAGLRLRVGSELEMPFPDRLVAAYLGIERDAARASINALRADEVIAVTGRSGPRGPFLFLPGGGA